MFQHIELRPYQIDAINQIRDAYRAGRRAPLFVLPTGGGKTYTFSAITSIIQRRNKRVTILVHRDRLLQQTHEALNALGIDHGLISAGRTPLDRQVQVASVYTLTRRVQDMHAPNLYIIDEAHHVRAKTWANIIQEHNRSLLLGVTATPCRLDGSGLGVQSGGFFDCMIQGPTMSELMEYGNLCEYDYYQPPAGVDLSKVGTNAGDYNRKQLNTAMNKSTITGCAVQHYSNICPGEPAIAFCVSIDHAKAVADDFSAAGYRAMALHSKLSKDQINSAIKGLGEGRIDVVASCDLISEGVDVPIVSAAILLRPTHSLGMFLQQVGRVLRPAPGKVAKILDHVGNIKHDLPDADRNWSLDAVKKKTRMGEILEKPPAVRQCGHCYHIHRPQPTCPKCGFVYSGGREIQTVDGTLHKVSREEIQKAKKQRQYQRMNENGGAQTLDELKAIGLARGYKPQWAHKIWAVRQKKEQARVDKSEQQQTIGGV